MPSSLAAMAAGDSTAVKALQNISKKFLEAFPVRYLGTPDLTALSPCPVHSHFDPLPDHPQLKLGQGSQQI